MPYITDASGNYVPTPTIQGADGKEVTLRVSNGYIQWKREDTDWANLIAVSSLVGASGEKVQLNANGYVLQYKYESDSTWIELCDLSDYFGNTAAATAAAAANAAAVEANAAAEAAREAVLEIVPAHAASHASDGSDPIDPLSIGAARDSDVETLVNELYMAINNHTHTPASIGAAAADHTHTPASIGAAASVSKITPSGGTVNLTLADNTEYRFTSAVTSLTLTFPSGNFDCWLKFTTGSSISVNFPANATYLGGAPTFEASKTYEMSIKDGSVICAEVEGSLLA